MTAAELRELRELVERYAQAVDRRDPGAVAELFTEDGVLETWLDPGTDAPTGEHRGRDAIASAIAGVTQYDATHHTISSSHGELDGVHASGETFCVAHHVKGKQDRVLYIRYVDTFARSGGSGWLIARREVRVQWTTTLPVDG